MIKHTFKIPISIEIEVKNFNEYLSKLRDAENSLSTLHLKSFFITVKLLTMILWIITLIIIECHYGRIQGP